MVAQEEMGPRPCLALMAMVVLIVAQAHPGAYQISTRMGTRRTKGMRHSKTMIMIWRVINFNNIKHTFIQTRKIIQITIFFKF